MSDFPGAPDFDRLPRPQLLERYLVGVEYIDKRVLNLPDEQLDAAFEPADEAGRWPIRVLLGHLADAEVLFTSRLRRIYSEDGPVLHPWDEHAPIDAGMYGTTGARPVGALPVAGAVATVFTLRRWNGDWLRAVLEHESSHGDPAGWDRAGLHPEHGAQTIDQILRYTTWHLEHHARILTRKLDHLGASV